MTTVEEAGPPPDFLSSHPSPPKSSRLAVSDLLSAPTAGSSRTSPSRQATGDSTSSLEHSTHDADKGSRRASSPIIGDGNPMSEAAAAYQYASVQQITENRANIEYVLTIREQPKHSRMCGVGEKADRRPIDPAPIIQLRVITHDHPPPNKEATSDQIVSKPPQGNEIAVAPPPQELKSNQSSPDNKAVMLRRGVPVRTEWGDGWEDKTWYLENPYYFMYAMLANAETDEELHLLGDGKTRYTTGSCVSCLYHLKDIDGSEQGFFVFPDLSIRVEGQYRLKLCLFETIGHEVHHCKSIYSSPFNVYTAKRFPGMEESTLLSKSFADQGLKVRVRKNPRARRLRGNGKRKEILNSDEDSDGDPYTAPEPGLSTVKRVKNDGDTVTHLPGIHNRQQFTHHNYMPPSSSRGPSHPRTDPKFHDAPFVRPQPPLRSHNSDLPPVTRSYGPPGHHYDAAPLDPRENPPYGGLLRPMSSHRGEPYRGTRDERYADEYAAVHPAYRERNPRYVPVDDRGAMYDGYYTHPRSGPMYDAGSGPTSSRPVDMGVRGEPLYQPRQYTHHHQRPPTPLSFRDRSMSDPHRSAHFYGPTRGESDEHMEARTRLPPLHIALSPSTSPGLSKSGASPHNTHIPGQPPSHYRSHTSHFRP